MGIYALRELILRAHRGFSLAEQAGRTAGPMSAVLGHTEEQVVSSDFISDPHSSIYDASAGMGLSDRFFKVVSWYDNEMGYAVRCVDMLRFMAEKEPAGSKSRQAVGA